jgi:ABC-2 type transport system permease protein
MPIHDQSYRRYGGGKATPGKAWTVIAWAGIRSMIRKRAFLGLLIFSWIPFVVRAVQIYLAENFPQMALLAPTAETFRQYLEQQDFFVFVVTVYAGAGLIANDRRANALQIYLSKPLLRSEYIAGKAGVLFSFLMLVTWLPAMVLLLIQVMFAGSFAFLKANLFLFPAITVAALLQVMLATFTMLALSSLSKSARYVGILYSGIIFFTKAIYGVTYGITGGSTALSYLSLSDNLKQVVDVIFRLPPRYSTPWAVSLTVVVALVALSISILERRVRGVEVVT